MSASDGRPLRSGTQSIERAIAILECLRLSDRPLGLSDIASEVQLTASTTHRVLRAFVRAGYIEQDQATEQYRLGIGIAVLGQRAIENSGYQLARPVLDDLSQRSGESASLAVRRGTEVVVIDRATGPAPLRFDHPTGSELAAYASAMGKALLAFSASSIDAEVARIPTLERFTDRTITERDALEAELSVTASRGYAINIEERYDGVSAVAAPVLSTRGRAHAAIGLQGPSVRLPAARLDELAPLVRDAATEIAALVIRH
ncbi:MAG: IclR family transcriptional regulator [Ilumatobacter sp.]|uniref:IclR family transcriptional regulator n=1 Tax=Ilumatobacter sp. TaxID=1967498 RepID=UPI003298D382